MKKGQVNIGLVILGVTAIIAIIGLVLLFTRASTAGSAIGDIYGRPMGIAQPYQQLPVMETPYYPETVPVSGITTIGTRTPAFMIKGYTSIEDLYGCSDDLRPVFGVVHDMFNCYTVPTYSPSREVKGYYPGASAAEKRLPTSVYGKYGGDVYCYANAPYNDELVRQRIIATTGWPTIIINGKNVPVCWVSKKTFPFRQ